MYKLLFKSVLFWTFAVALLLSMLSLGLDSKAYSEWHGSGKIIVAEKISKNAPIEQCLDVSKNTLLEFDQFLDGFEQLIVHTDKSKRRGLSNGEKIYIRCIEDMEEFENVLIHEIGHVVDLTYLNGTNSAVDTIFHDFGDPIKADDPSFVYYNFSWSDTDTHSEHVHDDDFVSEYGSTDPFEDFAEAFLMYVKHGEMFRYAAYKLDNHDLKKKYIFIKTEVFDGKEFGENTGLSLKALKLLRKKWDPVFDMTKLYNLV